MLLDALFRSEPLENPSVPVTGEAAETDNIFARDVYVSPETSMWLLSMPVFMLFHPVWLRCPCM